MFCGGAPDCGGMTGQCALEMALHERPNCAIVCGEQPVLVRIRGGGHVSTTVLDVVCPRPIPAPR